MVINYMKAELGLDSKYQKKVPRGKFSLNFQLKQDENKYFWDMADKYIVVLSPKANC